MELAILIFMIFAGIGSLITLVTWFIRAWRE